jgi:predicted transcriptional regulator
VAPQASPATLVLRHASRRRLHEYIGLHPGLSFTELRVAFHLDDRRLGNGVLAWHLRCLEEAGLVQSVRVGRWRRYYPVGLASPAGLRHRALLLNPALASLAAELAARPHCTVRELVAGGHGEGWLVRHRLRRLAAVGLVAKTRVGVRNQYAPTENLLRLTDDLRTRTTPKRDVTPTAVPSPPTGRALPVRIVPHRPMARPSAASNPCPTQSSAPTPHSGWR